MTSHARPGRSTERIEAELIRLRGLTLRDDLTGLTNRRAFLQRMHAAFGEARAGGPGFSVILLDMDGLKDINDTFGHQIGDRALQFFAEALAGGVRSGDLVARISGDEFAVIAIGAAGDARAAYRRLKETAAGIVRPLKPGGPDVLLSASIGQGVWTPGSPSVEAIVTAAEADLAAAKATPALPVAPAGAFRPRGRRALGDELRELLAMARQVTASGGMTDLLRRVTEQAAALIGARFGRIALAMPDGMVRSDELWRDGVWEPIPYESAPGAGVVGRVTAGGRPEVHNTLSADVLYNPSVLTTLGIRAAVCVPLRDHDGAPFGALALMNKRGDQPFLESDVGLAQAFADLAASAIENARGVAAAEEARAYQRALMDQAHDAILVVDPDTGRLLEANGAAVQLTGYDHETLLRRTVDDLRLPLERMQRPAGTSLVIVAEGICRHDGAMLPVELSVSRVQTPRGERLLVIVRDLRERLAAERAIDERGRELEAQTTVAAILARSHATDEGLQTVLPVIMQAAGVDAACIILPQNGRLRLAAKIGVPHQLVRILADPATSPAEYLLGAAAGGRETVVVDDVQTDPRPLIPQLRETRVGSYALTPLIADHRNLGLLAAGCSEPHALDTARVDRLRAFADQLAVWLAGRVLLEETHQREQDARFLVELGESLNQSNDEAEILRRVVRGMAEAALGGASMLMRDVAGKAWYQGPFWHINSDYLPVMEAAAASAPWPEDATPAAVRARGTAPALIDLAAAPPGDPLLDALRLHRCHSLVTAPLFMENELLGVLIAFAGDDSPPLTERHLALVQQVAQHAAVAVANVRAYRAADQSRAFLRAMMEDADVALFVADGPRGVIDTNAAAEALTGIDREALIGRLPATLVVPRDQSPIEQMVAGLTGHARQQDRPIRIRRPDGRTRIARMSGSVMETPSGPVQIIALRDVTDEHRTQRERERLLQRVREEAQLSGVLLDLAAELTQAPDPDEVTQVALHACRRLAHVGRAAIFLWDSTDEVYRPGVVAGLSDEHMELVKTLTLDPRQMPGFADLVRSEHAIVVPDGLDDPRWPRDVKVQFAVQSAVLFPLRVAGEPLGFLAADHKIRSRRFSRRDVTLLDGIARQTASALASALQRRHIEEARDYLHTVMQHAGDGILVIDAATHLIVDVNQRHCEMSGRRREEVIGRSILDLAAPEDVAVMRAVSDSIAATEPPRTYRRTLIRTDGERIPIEVIPTLVVVGGRALIISVVRDLRARIEAERQVRFQAQVLANVHDAVVATDTDGKIMTWNRAAEDLYGIGADQALGRHYTEVAAPEQAPHYERNRQHLAQSPIFRGELPLMRLDGVQLWCDVTITLLRDRDGKEAGAISVLRDITERRAAGARLRMFAQIVADAGEAIIVSDLSGQIAYANPAAHTILGYQPEALIGRDGRSFFARDVSRDALRAGVIQALHGRWQGEVTLRRADGSHVILRGTSAPLLGDDGRAVATVTVAEDVTAEHAARTEQRALLDRLTRANETATRRTAELRTIADLSGIVVAGGDPDTVFDSLARRILDASTFDVAIVGLFNAGQDSWTMRTIQHRLPEAPVNLLALAGQTYPPRSFHTFEAILRERRPVVLPPAGDRAGSASAAGAIALRDGLPLVVIVPLFYGGDLIGTLGLYARKEREVPADELRLLQALADQVAAAIRNATNMDRIREMRRDAIFRLAIACEALDSDTGGHLRRIQTTTESLCRQLGLPAAQVEEIGLASVLHDIGKIALPRAMLQKPGPLTPDESRLMQQHTILGEEMLAGPDFYATARQVSRHHHERWDGSGYPDGLAGGTIPLAARVVAVADVFDALTSRRVYKPAWDVDLAARHILSHAGRHFDPQVAAALESLWRDDDLPQLSIDRLI